MRYFFVSIYLRVLYIAVVLVWRLFPTLYHVNYCASPEASQQKINLPHWKILKKPSEIAFPESNLRYTSRLSYYNVRHTTCTPYTYIYIYAGTTALQVAATLSLSLPAQSPPPARRSESRFKDRRCNVGSNALSLSLARAANRINDGNYHIHCIVGRVQQVSCVRERERDDARRIWKARAAMLISTPCASERARWIAIRRALSRISGVYICVVEKLRIIIIWTCASWRGDN